MPQVAREEVKERAKRLRTLGQTRLEAYLASQVGREHKVLMERERLGRTETFAEVSFGTPKPVGAILSTTVCGVDGKRRAA